MKKTVSLRELEGILQSAGLLVSAAKEDLQISHISNHSKDVKEATLFICKGFGFKKEYLLDAMNSGVVCGIGELDYAEGALPFVTVTDIRKAQSLLAKYFYEEPSSAFRLVGITGTKGKTTTAYDLKAVLDACSQRETGLLSTVERFVGDVHEPSHLTTPESLDLQQLFVRAKENGLPYLTMEVSSQAYKLDRVYGQQFDYGIFLNFGADHICDREHSDLEDYFSCKLELMRHCNKAIICKETDRFDAIYAVAEESAKEVILVGMEDASCDYTAKEIKKEAIGFSFVVLEKKSGEKFAFSLLQEGRFNIANALVAIAVAREEGFAFATIAAALKNLAIPGRMNRISGSDLVVFVDYAHNELSFSSLFESLKQDYPTAHITVVAGAPGERALSRRKDIGGICGELADRVVFTADDPGFEDPEKICEEMAAFAKEGGKAEVLILPDRKEAVTFAVESAPAGSIVVLAGKGHETTQRVRGEYLPYESDAAVAKWALTKRKPAQ